MPRARLSIIASLICCFVFLSSFFLDKQPDLTIFGFCNMADGVGRQSPELIEAFKEELSINFIPTRQSKLTDVPKSIKKILKGKNQDLGKVILFEDLIWWPGEEKFRKLDLPEAKKSIKIAYSMFESTQIPPEWVIILNNYFDAVAVPDRFLIDVYEKSGVKIPIFELPLALNLDRYLAKPLKTHRRSPLVFANFSASSDRKNQLLLIRAFAKAFGDRADVLLRINSRSGEPHVREAITKEIAELNATNIVFTQFNLSQEEYLNLFDQVDCYVSLSKGEGFSIQPREAMALGIPVIATDNTGQSTICQSGLVKSVDSPHQQPALYPWGDYYGYSFNCSLTDAADALRDMYDHYDDYLNKAPMSRTWAKQYQYEALKPLYRSLLHPQKVLLGPVNQLTPDGLITTSPELAAKYQSLFP